MPEPLPTIDYATMSNNEIAAIEKIILDAGTETNDKEQDWAILLTNKTRYLTRSNTKLSQAFLDLKLSCYPTTFDHAKLLDKRSVFEIWPPKFLLQ